MQTMRVWTKQHQSVWRTLQTEGVYHATGDRIFRNEDSQLMKDAYNWLASNIPNSGSKPHGAAYPIWLSSSHAGTMLLTPDTLDKLRTRQVRLETAEAARTLCVTINPVSAYGWKFDKDEFMARMKEAVDVPVINVKEELA